MGSVRPDLSCRVYPEPVDHFDQLSDSLILLVFNMIGDVKALGRYCVISKRFHSLVPQVDNVVVRVDCVISNEDGSSPSSAMAASAVAADKSRHPISSILRLVFTGQLKPFQSLSQFIFASASPRRVGVSSAMEDDEFDQSSVTQGCLNLAIWHLNFHCRAAYPSTPSPKNSRALCPFSVVVALQEELASSLSMSLQFTELSSTSMAMALKYLGTKSSEVSWSILSHPSSSPEQEKTKKPLYWTVT